MKLLLKKNEVSQKLNDIKSSMNSNLNGLFELKSSIRILKNWLLFKKIIVGTSFGDVFHQKVACEDDREVILMTRKKTENIFNFDRKTSDDEDDEAKSDFMALKNELNDTVEEEKNRDQDGDSPKYKIEFNHRNQIELVPRDQREDKPTDAGQSFFFCIRNNTIFNSTQ